MSVVEHDMTPSLRINDLPNDQAASSAEGHIARFTADTVHGPVLLSLRTRQLNPSILEQALLLCELEEEIQFLENWLQLPLDFAPSTPPYECLTDIAGKEETGVEQTVQLEPSDHLPLSFTAQLYRANDAAQNEHGSVRDDDAARLTVELGVALFKHLQRLGQRTSIDPMATIVRWVRQTARLELDRFELGESDIAKLGEGATVLLPGSFTPSWSVRLILGAADSDSLIVAAQLDITSRSLVDPSISTISNTDSEMTNGYQCVVCSSLDMTLDPGAILAQEPIELSDPSLLSHASSVVVDIVNVGSSSVKHSSGRGGMIAVGDGRAVQLTQLACSSTSMSPLASDFTSAQSSACSPEISPLESVD